MSNCTSHTPVQLALNMAFPPFPGNGCLVAGIDSYAPISLASTHHCPGQFECITHRGSWQNWIFIVYNMILHLLILTYYLLIQCISVNMQVWHKSVLMLQYILNSFYSWKLIYIFHVYLEKKKNFNNNALKSEEHV